MVDVRFCEECNKPNPVYARSCESCDAALLEESPPSDGEVKTGGSSVVGALIVIVFILSMFFGGWLSVLIAGGIYIPFRRWRNSWLFFVVPIIAFQIGIFVFVRR